MMKESGAVCGPAECVERWVCRVLGEEIKGGLASVGWKERAAWKGMCVSCAGKGEGQHRGSEGRSRGKGCLVGLLKGGLNVVKISKSLSHLWKYLSSIHVSSLLCSHGACGILRRSFSYILDPTIHCTIYRVSQKCICTL